MNGEYIHVIRWSTLSPSLPQLLWKVRSWVIHTSHKVRSPSQVKWSHYTKTLQSCDNYSVWGKVMKPSEYDKVISTYNTHISVLIWLWPQVRSFSWPPISQGQKINSTFYASAGAYLNRIACFKTSIDNSGQIFRHWLLLRSFKVIRGHQQFFCQ